MYIYRLKRKKHYSHTKKCVYLNMINRTDQLNLILFSEYYLVQFIEDNVKLIVADNQIEKEGNRVKAMYSDKKYDPCIIIAENGNCSVFTYTILFSY